MAVAEIIGAAIGVMLLVVVAYMLVGSVLTAAEVVSTAQKDLTLQDEARMRTAFTISDKAYNPNGNITYKIFNKGTEIISDFKHMDVIVEQNGEYNIYPYDATASNTQGTWYISGRLKDSIHPYQLDPGETFEITVILSDLIPPEWFQMTTGNGVYASDYI